MIEAVVDAFEQMAWAGLDPRQVGARGVPYRARGGWRPTEPSPPLKGGLRMLANRGGGDLDPHSRSGAGQKLCHQRVCGFD